MQQGATIGSNHNSRSPDGEVVAGRGFWPGLCVSLKHNSKFASFTIIAKGDYPAELNIPVPFSLVSNDVARDTLVVMPAYWFLYNMYALARNSWKYGDRDKRTEKNQLIEYDFLAPDTINEIIASLSLFERLTGDAWKAKYNGSSGDATTIGKTLLEKDDPSLHQLDIYADGFENATRKVKLVKVPAAYHVFKELINYHAASLIIDFAISQKIKAANDLVSALPKPSLSEWQNVGGQLITTAALDKALENVKSGRMKSWENIHDFYIQQADRYPREKLAHALGALKHVSGISISRNKTAPLLQLLQASIKTKQWMVANIYSSREKDYTNPFRSMVYSNPGEMKEVVGALEDNPFIKQEKENLARYTKNVSRVLRLFNGKTVS